MVISNNHDFYLLIYLSFKGYARFGVYHKMSELRFDMHPLASYATITLTLTFTRNIYHYHYHSDFWQHFRWLSQCQLDIYNFLQLTVHL